MLFTEQLVLKPVFLRYIKANGGIDTEASYPYIGKDEKCRFKAADVGADDTGKCRNAVGLSNDSDDNRKLPNTNLACNDMKIMLCMISR